ncbi:MAG: DUF305 domain-containing protein [Candidatus Planktophila sp.]
MQINIDKKSGIFISVIALLLIIIIGMGMSGRSNDGFFGMHHNDADMMDENYFNSSGDLTGSDIMFFQMMIPHHQQAVEISDLALARSKDPELLALARQIRDGQASEIITMKAWLDAANAGLDMGHHMDDSMGGMLGDAELADLKAASGKNFDLLWLSGMTEHHDGALHMTTMIRDSGKAQIKTFGEAIVIAQSKQITQMAAMMKRMG